MRLNVWKAVVRWRSIRSNKKTVVQCVGAEKKDSRIIEHWSYRRSSFSVSANLKDDNYFALNPRRSSQVAEKGRYRDSYLMEVAGRSKNDGLIHAVGIPSREKGRYFGRC